jgi:hypothetical protein
MITYRAPKLAVDTTGGIEENVAVLSEQALVGFVGRLNRHRKYGERGNRWNGSVMKARLLKDRLAPNLVTCMIPIFDHYQSQL